MQCIIEDWSDNTVSVSGLIPFTRHGLQEWFLSEEREVSSESLVVPFCHPPKKLKQKNTSKEYIFFLFRYLLKYLKIANHKGPKLLDKWMEIN